MSNFNNNVFKQGHFESWNNNFGQNFTDNFSDLHKQRMLEKNIETGGSYQAQLSGAYGEFTVSTIFKSLPEEYHVMDNILLQTGTLFRKYNIKSFQKYGETPWELAIKTGKKKFKLVRKDVAMQHILSNPNAIYYEIVKKSSQIDHLIVSPYGIFVIETKNHKGWVFGSDYRSKVWTQVLNGENGCYAYGGHAHFTFFNPVTQNELHMKHLSNHLGISRSYMTGMVVFTNPEVYLGNVQSKYCFTLDSLYSAILSYNKILWDKKQLENLIERIEKLNTSSYKLNKEHTVYVKDIQHRKEVNNFYRRENQ